jgi:hypothetical protein
MIATTSGGLVIDGYNAANQGSIGVLETGSATGANFLAGSFGNDVINGGAGGGTVITEGGGDTIALGTHAGKTDFIDLYVGIGGHTNTPDYASVAGAIVNAAGLTEDGFWGNAPGATKSILTLADATGFSTDASTVSGFNVATDVVNISISAWTSGGGPYFGLETLGQSHVVTAGTQSAQAIGPGGVIGGPGFTTATVLELGSGGANGLVNPPEFTNAGNLASQLQSDSYHLTLGAPFALAGSSADFIVAYQNTAGNTVIADLNLLSKVAGATDLGTQFSVHVSDMVVLTGVALSTFTVANTAGVHTDLFFHT